MEIETREQAEAALSLIGQIDARIKIIEGTAEEAKARIDKEVAQDCTSLEELRAEQEKALEAWGRSNRTTSKKGKLQKTMKLKCGKLQFKNKPPSVKFSTDEEVVIKAIRQDKDPKVKACLTVTPKIDKQAVKKLPASILKRLGVQLTKGVESFTAKPLGKFKPYDDGQE